jgi:hypothetical protein
MIICDRNSYTSYYVSQDIAVSIDIEIPHRETAFTFHEHFYVKGLFSLLQSFLCPLALQTAPHHFLADSLLPYYHILLDHCSIELTRAVGPLLFPRGIIVGKLIEA